MTIAVKYASSQSKCSLCINAPGGRDKLTTYIVFVRTRREESGAKMGIESAVQMNRCQMAEISFSLPEEARNVL